MTVSTRVVQLFLRQEGRAYVPLENGLRLQTLPDFSFLPQCQKHHFAAFIQDPAMLVVWDDQPTHILSRVKNIEEQLMSMIWNDSAEADGILSPSPRNISNRQTSVHIQDVNNDADGHNEKMLEKPRRIVFLQSVLTAITLILVITAIGNGLRRMIIEVKVDHNYFRLALLVVAPLQIWLALVTPYQQQSSKPVTDISSVLYAVSSNWSCTNDWTHQSDECEHQVLFWCGAASTIRFSLATCHYPMPSIQRRPQSSH